MLETELVDAVLLGVEGEAEARLQAELNEHARDLLRLERFVVARWARLHPGPGMVGYLCGKAKQPLERFRRELTDVEALVARFARREREIHRARNGWSHVRRMLFLCELRAARQA